MISVNFLKFMKVVLSDLFVSNMLSNTVRVNLFSMLFNNGFDIFLSKIDITNTEFPCKLVEICSRITYLRNVYVSNS